MRANRRRVPDVGLLTDPDARYLFIGWSVVQEGPDRPITYAGYGQWWLCRLPNLRLQRLGIASRGYARRWRCVVRGGEVRLKAVGYTGRKLYPPYLIQEARRLLAVKHQMRLRTLYDFETGELLLTRCHVPPPRGTIALL